MKTILSILAATALIAPGAVASEVDPGFSALEVDPGFSQREPVTSPGVHPIARILLFPIVGLAEIQAGLSPETASCWNEGASEVVGCNVVSAVEDAKEARPTPYVE